MTAEWGEWQEGPVGSAFRQRGEGPYPETEFADAAYLNALESENKRLAGKAELAGLIRQWAEPDGRAITIMERAGLQGWVGGFEAWLAHYDALTASEPSHTSTREE